jgi:hypothetical protein
MNVTALCVGALKRSVPTRAANHGSPGDRLPDRDHRRRPEQVRAVEHLPSVLRHIALGPRLGPRGREWHDGEIGRAGGGRRDSKLRAYHRRLERLTAPTTRDPN